MGSGRSNDVPGGHCHASPSFPALLAGSGRCGGLAEACQEGSGARCRGESGWCSDMTSSHGARRHAGTRFLLSGGLRFSHCSRSMRGACNVATHPSVVPVLNRSGPHTQHGRGESGWCSDMTSTHGAWRHAGTRFLLSGGLRFSHCSRSMRGACNVATLHQPCPCSIAAAPTHNTAGVSRAGART